LGVGALQDVDSRDKRGHDERSVTILRKKIMPGARPGMIDWI
jgi:hypothetical protein